jgi:hypothetical protein
MIALLLIATSFAACATAGLWVLRSVNVSNHRPSGARALPPAGPDEPWVARTPPSIAGTHVWAGQAEAGALRTPPDCAAIIVGPPKAGKTRKVIASTRPARAGPAPVTSTKGDILQSAGHRSRIGPVAVYDPARSLGHPEANVGFSPLSRCETWDGAVEVAAALLSPASADETVRHGEHFAIAARALLAPLFHPAALSGGGVDRARGWLGRSEFSEPAEILRGHGATIALEELSGVAAQAVGDCRTSVLGTAQVALVWASRAAVRASSDPALTPQIDLGELIATNGTLYVVSPSRIQEELAPLIAALLDALCAQAIDLAITSSSGRLERPLLLALDEVANIAPIRSLPRLLSEGIQQGIVPVLGVQDMSQARARWGEHETATMWSTPALRLVLAARRSARPPRPPIRSSAPAEPTPGATATPTPSSASESYIPRTCGRCPPAEPSRFPRGESPSGSTCSTVPPVSPTATGPRCAAPGVSGCVAHADRAVVHVEGLASPSPYRASTTAVFDFRKYLFCRRRFFVPDV